MKLAEQLIALRREKGWTQAEAAEIISIQQSYLSKLENGHFIPSDDVVEKLSKAYNIKIEKFLNTTKPNASRVFYIVLPLLGLFLILSGSNSLLFSSTFYTYKTEPILPAIKDEVYFNYHLSDIYRGEKLIVEKSGTKYHFTLIATREIERQENRLQIIFGFAFLLIICGLAINRIFPQMKGFFASNGKNSANSKT